MNNNTGAKYMSNNKFINSVGLSNLITVVILAVGLIAMFVRMDYTVGNMQAELEKEIFERQRVDTVILERLDEFTRINDKAHILIQNAIKEDLVEIKSEIKAIRTDVTYHLGQHEGITPSKQK